MSDIKWDVYLLGETQLGVERSTLVRNLATLFKKDVPVIEKMLRKPRSLLKSDVDLATAKKYKAAIDKAGGLCELVEHGEQLFPSDALSPVEPRPTLSVAPIETPAVSADSDADYSANTYASPYESPQANVQGPSQFCFKCGASLYAGMTHCPKCFTEQPHFKRKSKITAGVLAFFIGGLGIHRFYLGQWWGVLYLLFWGSLIPSIVSLIEAFVFWFTSDENWERKYGQVPSKGPGMVVALIVGAILMISIVGILAAIALPAYQDYTARAKVSAAAPLVDDARTKVEKTILEKGFLPSENILAGLPENISGQYVESILLSDGARMVVTYNVFMYGNKAPTIIWTPTRSGDRVNWDCKGGTLPDKARPLECRGGSGATSGTGSSPAEATTTDTRIYSDDKKISLVVPGNWKGDRQISAHAILGVSNLFAASFAMVMSEAKQDFDTPITTAGYLKLVKDHLQTDSGVRELQPIKAVKINGRVAQQQVVAFASEGTKVIYILTVFENETNFYIVYAWTLEEDYQKNQAILRKVSNSFTIHK